MGILTLPANIVISPKSTFSKAGNQAFPQNPGFSTGRMWKPLKGSQNLYISPQYIVERTPPGLVKPTSCADFTMFSTVC